MITVYHKPYNGGLTHSYEIETSNDSFIIQCELKKEKITAIADFHIPSYKGKCLKVFASKDSLNNVSIHLVDLVEESLFQHIHYTKANGYYRIARIVFDLNGDVHIATQGHIEDIPGCKNVVMPKGVPDSEFFTENIPLYSKLLRLQKAKLKLYKNVDALASISYLESQVDLLTKIILDAGIATGDQLESLLAYNKYSVLKSKDPTKEVVNKKHVRDVQKVYYKEKNE